MEVLPSRSVLGGSACSTRPRRLALRAGRAGLASSSLVQYQHQHHTAPPAPVWGLRPAAPTLAPHPAGAPRPGCGRGGSAVARSTLDSPEIAPLVERMLASRSAPGPREQLQRCIALIDDINSKDPTVVEYEGRRQPYRLLFSTWLTDWVRKLDPGAPDELYILARGKAVESWRLSELKRDDYSPNTGGQRQWEQDRKIWMANRLKAVMKEAGYGDGPQRLVEDFMLGRELPDPRDVRLYDVTGPMGTINTRLLELLLMVQTLRDAEALVFLERTFPRMFEGLPADEVMPAVRRELAAVSKKCLATALQLPWPPLQLKLLRRALPAPPGFGDVLRSLEGTASASTHPGDWRFRGYDYE